MAYRLVSKTSGFTSMRVRLPPHPLKQIVSVRLIYKIKMAENFRHNERAYQLRLKEETPKVIWLFKPGTWIYPWRSYYGGGTLETDVSADRSNEKAYGLKHIFTSRESAKFFYRGKYYTLPEGTRFQALSSKAHKKTLA